MKIKRKIRYAMVGGGPGSFIGKVHRMAAALDGEIDLAAGVFSSSPEKSLITGRELHLDPDRVYSSYQEMAEKEKKLSADKRIGFVSITTPNYLHFPIAKTFIESGFHVVCDKPMTTSLEDSEELCRLVGKYNTIFALTHNYTGYPMVKQARELIRKGVLGKIRKVMVAYSQGWLYNYLEGTKHKQAAWRTDPQKAGISLCIGDIGCHAEHLARYITCLRMEEICADLTTFIPGRKLEDDGNILVRYNGGARGILYASQISVGEENNLSIRVYGNKASLEWRQENPDYLFLRYPDAPEKVYKKGNEYLEPIVKHNTRVPCGHPEGYLEAFANIYRNAARTIAARIEGTKPGAFDTDFPTVQDGAIGVHFIHKAVESSRKGSWVDMHYKPNP